MRSVIAGLILAGLVSAGLGPASGPVFAAAGKSTATEGAAKADDHKEEEKLDLFKGAIDLTIYTIIVFIILFLILRAYAWGPIREGLDRRERSIAHDKQEALRAKQEADALRARLDQELARANEEVRQMIEKARQDAGAVAAAEMARGKAELQAEKDRLKRDLEIQEKQALQQAVEKSVGLATLISAKAVKKSLTEEDHRALLDEALAEFKAAAQTRLADLTSARA